MMASSDTIISNDMKKRKIIKGSPKSKNTLLSVSLAIIAPITTLSLSSFFVHAKEKITISEFSVSSAPADITHGVPMVTYGLRYLTHTRLAKLLPTLISQSL